MTENIMPDDRNYRGYGASPPDPRWPGGARLAVQIVLNYEEGGENSIVNGDAGAETFLSEIVGAAQVPGARHMSMESLYEYGSRAGVWRLLRLFGKYDIPVTVFAVAMALEKYPEMAESFLSHGHEIACHGYRWINYQDIAIEIERDHMTRAIEIFRRLTGERPLGWYTGRTSPNSRQLVIEDGGFLYDADDYSDDLPFWIRGNEQPQLIIPYTLDVNDMRFTSPQGFNCGDQFFTYLKDTFDALYEEGLTSPKMMSVGLHCRIAGKPGRIRALEKFLSYIKSKEDIWICRRSDIARHWHTYHPCPGDKEMTGTALPEYTKLADFIVAYGGIYEHSPWIAERAFSKPEKNTVEALHAVLKHIVEGAEEDLKLRLILAHPDLACAPDRRDRLTNASRNEQGGAGLNHCTEEEYLAFQDLNRRYRAKFGFPFIIAVKGLDRSEILARFRDRINNDKSVEFDTALTEIHKIAWWRLGELAQ